MHRVLLMNEVLWRRVYCIQLSKLLLNLRNEFGVDLVNDNDDSRFLYCLKGKLSKCGVDSTSYIYFLGEE